MCRFCTDLFVLVHSINSWMAARYEWLKAAIMCVELVFIEQEDLYQNQRLHFEPQVLVQRVREAV